MKRGGRIFPFAVLIAFVFAILLIGTFQLAKRRTSASDIKLLAEKWIGKVLDTEVRVSDLKIGMFKHLSIGKLEIGKEGPKHRFFVGVERVVVRYDLLSLVRRNFRIPANIFLEAPKFSLAALRRRENPFNAGLLKSGGSLLTHIEFENGTIELPWFDETPGLRLTSASGKAASKSGSVYRLNVRASVEGAARGEIRVRGLLDLAGGETDLKVELNRISFVPESGFPITDLDGMLRIKSSEIQFEAVRFLIRGVPFEFSGGAGGVFTDHPVVDAVFKVSEEHVPVFVEVHADFGRGTLEGLARLLSNSYRLNGAVSRAGHVIRASHVSVNEITQLSAALDFGRKVFQLDLAHESERAKFILALEGFSGKASVNLDHFDFFGHDLVTSATLAFKPNRGSWAFKSHVFDLEMNTDYLIFRHQLLKDFHAAGELSATGLNRILARWGAVSELRGSLAFANPPQADLSLRVGKISIESFRAIGSHPLPGSLAGQLEGRLDMRGAVNSPQLIGDFDIEKGRLGSLDYDRAQILFNGQLPYLPLSDSKIWKGKHRFGLKGGLNFNLKNVLKGISVENTEHVVIWKGFELSREQEDSALEPGGSGRSAASVPKSSEGLRAGERSFGQIGAIHPLGSRATLQLAAEEEQGKKDYVTVSTKVKF